MKKLNKTGLIPMLLCIMILFTSTWKLNYAENDDASEAERLQEEAEAELEKQRQEAEKAAEEAYEQALRDEEARKAELQRQIDEAYAYAQQAQEQSPTVSQQAVSDSDIAEFEEAAGIPVATNDTRWVINEDGSTTFKLGGLTVPFNVDEYIANVDETTFFYQCVQAEAGNQSALGKRMVADVLLNRVADPHFANDMKGVILQSGAFEVVTRGYIFTQEPSEHTMRCCDLELEGQIDYGVVYFRTGHFFTEFGIPYEQVGAHYFSKRAETDFDQGVASTQVTKDEEEDTAINATTVNKTRIKEEITPTPTPIPEAKKSARQKREER